MPRTTPNDARTHVARFRLVRARRAATEFVTGPNSQIFCGNVPICHGKGRRLSFHWKLADAPRATRLRASPVSPARSTRTKQHSSRRSSLPPLAALDPRVARLASRCRFPRTIRPRASDRPNASRPSSRRSTRARAPRPLASTCPPKRSRPRSAPTRVTPPPPRFATRRGCWRAPGRPRWRSCVADDASRRGERKRLSRRFATREKAKPPPPPARSRSDLIVLSSNASSRIRSSDVSRICVCAPSSPRGASWSTPPATE